MRRTSHKEIAIETKLRKWNWIRHWYRIGILKEAKEGENQDKYGKELLGERKENLVGGQKDRSE